MEKRSSSFEDFLSVVTSHEKTASAGKKNSGSKFGGLLEKLAEELDMTESSSVTDPEAPSNEGEVSPAESSVAGANNAVTSATEAVTVPQTTIAGGNPAEAAAGEMPGATKPNEGLAISAGDGKVTDANNLHRTPEAVAAAAESPDSDTGGDVGSAADVDPEKDGQMPSNEKTAEAKQIGTIMAKAFQETLEKDAEERQYSDALSFCKEAGLLDGYKISDPGMSKTASFEAGALEKIANGEKLSRRDIINAAIEYSELEKDAADAEEAGRNDARELANFVAGIQKEASEKANNEGSEREKIASLLKNPEISQAVRTLKEAGVI